MLTKNGLIIAALVLITILEIVSACGVRTCRGRYRGRRCHRYNGKRNADYEKDYYTYAPENTSCGETLCSSVRHYPHSQISEVVNRVRQVMSSHSASLQSERQRIDPVVSNFHSKPSSSVGIDTEIINSDGCEVHINVTHPQEGVSIDDGRIYYIVNIPSLQQRIKEAECITGNVCSNGIDLSVSMCRQAYRTEELLTLPLNVHHFDVSDFKIKNFELLNGCECSST